MSDDTKTAGTGEEVAVGLFGVFLGWLATAAYYSGQVKQVRRIAADRHEFGNTMSKAFSGSEEEIRRLQGKLIRAEKAQRKAKKAGR